MEQTKRTEGVIIRSYSLERNGGTNCSQANIGVPVLSEAEITNVSNLSWTSMWQLNKQSFQFIYISQTSQDRLSWCPTLRGQPYAGNWYGLDFPISSVRGQTLTLLDFGMSYKQENRDTYTKESHLENFTKIKVTENIYEGKSPPRYSSKERQSQVGNLHIRFQKSFPLCTEEAQNQRILLFPQMIFFASVKSRILMERELIHQVYPRKTCSQVMCPPIKRV